ncbi:hypothetical protein BKA70DRAFT_1233156 [Coprinopsis sp. MPI-PUGE-AT-0042]|nr:hypothetical protein BKA70DRAFT_1233156 [Coprinopsis sp. MPI-PUGE-AT-0042]
MQRNSSLSHHSRRLPGRTLPVALGSMQEVIITQPCRKTVSLLRGEMHCVYPQLCKHGPVPLSDRIEADVKTSAWFLDEKQSRLQALCEAGGGIVQLLEVYFNMVGDIQYSPGGLQAQEKLSSSGHASDEDEEGQELDVGNTAILPATPIKSRFCFTSGSCTAACQATQAESTAFENRELGNTDLIAQEVNEKGRDLEAVSPWCGAYLGVQVEWVRQSQIIVPDLAVAWTKRGETFLNDDTWSDSLRQIRELSLPCAQSPFRFFKALFTVILRGVTVGALAWPGCEWYQSLQKGSQCSRVLRPA